MYSSKAIAATVVALCFSLQGSDGFQSVFPAHKQAGLQKLNNQLGGPFGYEQGSRKQTSGFGGHRTQVCQFCWIFW